MDRKHRDTGRSIWTHAHEVLVLCGRCGKPGTVTASGRYVPGPAGFQCRYCVLTLKSTQDDWLGPVMLCGRGSCSHCGYKGLIARKQYGKLPRRDIRTLKVECPQCTRSTAVPVQAEPHRFSAMSLDPHFGMPLLLTEKTRLGQVWAYNAVHLADLAAYVAATLRERTYGNISRSMFARLPAWMKAARNRDMVLHAIARLQRRLLGAR